MIAGRARVGGESLQFFLCRLWRAGSSLESGCVTRRSCPTACQLLVIRGKLTQRRRRLRVQICESRAVHAHASSEAAVRIATDVLRHRHVRLCLGGVPVAESGEVGTQARVIAWLGALDELLHFECV